MQQQCDAASAATAKAAAAAMKAAQAARGRGLMRAGVIVLLLLCTAPLMAASQVSGSRNALRCASARARVCFPLLPRCKTAASPAHLQTHTPRPDAVANHIAQPPGPRPQQPEPRQPRRRRRRKRRRRRAQQRRRRRQLHVRQDRSGAARGALRVRDEPLPLGVARALRALVPLRRRAPRRARARAVRGARSGFFCL